MRFLLSFFAASAAVSSALAPRVARADERVAVEWTAPRECPSSAELASRTSSRVPPETSVRARGRVTKVGAKYKLLLEIDARGERALESESCDQLATSAAVVIAMSVASKNEEPEPAPAPVPAPAASPAPAAPAASPVPSRERDVAQPRPPADRGTVTLRPELVVDSGLLPSFGAGGGGAIGVGLARRLHLEAHAGAFASQDAHASSDASKGGTFSLFAGGARACWSVTADVEIAPCAGVVIARLAASGFGAAKVAEGDAVTWGPEAGAAVLVPIAGPVGLRAGAFALVPISRQSFVITARGEVHEPAAVSVRAFVGPEVRF